MWIKALYCTEDTEYANRLTEFFDSEYTNKFELNVCSSVDRAMQLLKGIDLVLFGKEFEAEIESKLRLIPCPVIIMADQIYESTLPGTHQVEKYQRGDVIYKQLLDCYATGSNVKTSRTPSGDGNNQKIYVFTSANGGNGTTTVARAFAKKCSVYEKTLYLDFGLYSDVQIENGSQNGMDEVILALKSRRNILSLKLSSAVGQTAHGFFGYGSCANPMDLMEINAKDIEDLLKEISQLTEYTKIIVDIGNSLTDRDLVFLKKADSIVFVLDERQVSIDKYGKFRALLTALEMKEGVKLLRKVAVFRNMVKNDYNNTNWPYDQEITGWAPLVTGVEDTEIIGSIANSDSFTNMEQ